MKRNILICTALLAAAYSQAQYQPTAGDTYPFTINGIHYEIVRDNQTWVNAAACAVARGGKLVEINSQEEQDSIFHYVNLANLNPANTVAPDGANSSYIWLGGNDMSAEGTWVWDGDNDGNTTPFWQGTASGSPINGQFNAWGLEPDNFAQIQHALGMAIINFPNGPAGTWNDVSPTNTLYYIIEFNGTAGVGAAVKPDFSAFPNPFTNGLTLQVPESAIGSSWFLENEVGSLIYSRVLLTTTTVISTSDLPAGTYFIRIDGHQGSPRVVKVD